MIDLDYGLRGKRALVTGAGQGVGRAIGRTLGAAGAEILVNDYVAERAEAVAEEIRAEGGTACPVPFDVTDFAAVHDAVAAAGAVDILVNNAGNAGADGWTMDTNFVDTQPGDWSKHIDVNLYGVMNCVHASLPSMIDRGWGRVVTVISEAARHGEAKIASYCGAKAGAAGFCRGIAHEVARHGVTVNIVSLAAMHTPMSAALWDDPEQEAQQKAILSQYLVRRPGQPEDPAWMILALVSPHASWITGQTVPVNGGYTFAL